MRSSTVTNIVLAMPIDPTNSAIPAKTARTTRIAAKVFSTSSMFFFSDTAA